LVHNAGSPHQENRATTARLHVDYGKLAASLFTDRPAVELATIVEVVDRTLDPAWMMEHRTPSMRITSCSVGVDAPPATQPVLRPSVGVAVWTGRMHPSLRPHLRLRWSPTADGRRDDPADASRRFIRRARNWRRHMTAAATDTGLQLRSTIRPDGVVELSLVSVPTPQPGSDEVLVRVEAAPINPSDLGLLLGGADPTTAEASGTADRPIVTATVPPVAMPALAGRLGQSLTVGNEGAGVVIQAGDAPAARALLGKTVAMLGGAMYAQYRCIKVSDCLVLPPGTTAAAGASCFVNPLTALGMVETMRREGHTALVHTAAASKRNSRSSRRCTPGRSPPTRDSPPARST
jgi:hypothetical protein